MLLQRIELKGFLSHYGQLNGSGAPGFAEVDLRASPLWLIHGPNGSGKSALFDAITVALFKEHRGGSKNFDRLIHDAADRAEINLELELDGQRYLVQRTITRKKRGGATVWGVVNRWNGNDWQKESGTEQNVEAWVQRKLRMGYDTFTSAVLLRQGEADAFLKAKPAERKDRLMELLDLEFYRKLGEAANARRTLWQRERERRQRDVDQLTPVTEEQVVAQRQRIAHAEQVLKQAQEAVKAKETELANARTATALIEEIAAKQAQQRADAALIDKAKEIVAAARRYRELRSVLPLLNNLHATRRRLRAEQRRLADTDAKITCLNQELAALDTHIAQAQDEAHAAQQAAEQGQAALEQATERQRVLNSQVEKLNQAERLEASIRMAEEKLQPYRSILAQAADIEQDDCRHEHLRELLPSLRTLAKATQHLHAANQRVDAACQSLAQRQAEVDAAKETEKRHQALVEAAAEAYIATERVLGEQRHALDLLNDKLQRRHSVTGADECPVCGSQLNDAETRTRLEHERAHWQTQIDQLATNIKRLRQRLDEQTQAKQDTETTFAHTKEATNQAEKQLTRAESDLHHAHDAQTQAQHTLYAAQGDAGVWADQLDRLAEWQAEFTNLNTLPNLWRKLEDARREEHAVSAIITTCRTQLAELPTWSSDARRQLRRDAAEVDQIVATCREQHAAANQAVKRTQERCGSLERQQQERRADLNAALQQQDDLEQRCAQVEQEIEQQRQALPPPWTAHPACADEVALATVEQERMALHNAEAEEMTLHEAQRRVQELEGAINTLQQQLSNIPAPHRRPVANVQSEYAALRDAVQHATEARDSETQALRDMEHQQQVYAMRHGERDEAEREWSYHDRLARAFGRSGLQAKIVQEAQHALKLHANTTLGRLSNGRWQIELQENEAQTELEILIRDLDQPGTPLRQFEYISSGEKFRVAVSLAIAIGQAVAGGRSVDTLIIDEGFGALDEINRALLVSELRHLSEDVLQGGRVVVVSHQDDVCEEFGCRYHIARNAHGHASIECVS